MGLFTRESTIAMPAGTCALPLSRYPEFDEHILPSSSRRLTRSHHHRRHCLGESSDRPAGARGRLLLDRVLRHATRDARRATRHNDASWDRASRVVPSDAVDRGVYVGVRARFPMMLLASVSWHLRERARHLSMKVVCSIHGPQTP